MEKKRGNTVVFPFIKGNNQRKEQLKPKRTGEAILDNV